MVHSGWWEGWASLGFWYFCLPGLRSNGCGYRGGYLWVGICRLELGWDGWGWGWVLYFGRVWVVFEVSLSRLLDFRGFRGAYFGGGGLGGAFAIF